MSASVHDLPLRSFTPDAWARQVLRRPLELLSDHAHLEKKAAANALELVSRWPQPDPPEQWVAAMTAIAREETEHLGQVNRLLNRRGGRLSRHHRNPYAAALRELVRRGQGANELMDRLMVSALIEARSAERFEVLGRITEDRELQRLYRDLWASEHGHYRTFLNLAQPLAPAAEFEQRWQDLLDAEARILADQPPGPRMHGGCEPPED
ncbi:MAG: DUF2202 domain-containing protein, partial [Phycisphaerae bacterium]|nr:DUF2202 domain-containing protein [Phycisphaerae bacterium]